MTSLPPGAMCRQHPDALATSLCGRCGSFFCDACARRTRPDAKPMCPACWDLRSKQFAVDQRSAPSKAIFTTALVLGCLSLVPIPAVMLASIVLSILGLVRARGEMAHQRWKPLVGLIVTLSSILGWVTVLVAVR
jgi:hypothetical protein